MKISSTSERLLQIMNNRHLKQVDILRLAAPFCEENDIKLNRNDLSQYVNGKVEPRQSKLYILGQALKVNEAWLMGYDVPMHQKALLSLIHLLKLRFQSSAPFALGFRWRLSRIY